MSKSRIGKTDTSKTIQKILRKSIAEDQRKIDKRMLLATRIKIVLEAKASRIKTSPPGSPNALLKLKSY